MIFGSDTLAAFVDLLFELLSFPETFFDTNGFFCWLLACLALFEVLLSEELLLLCDEDELLHAANVSPARSVALIVKSFFILIFLPINN